MHYYSPEDLLAPVASKACVVPELGAECVAGARDDLGALVTLVEAGLDITRFAEKLLLEHDIVHPELDLAHGALETVLVPGQGLSAVGVHLDTSWK